MSIGYPIRSADLAEFSRLRADGAVGADKVIGDVEDEERRYTEELRRAAEARVRMASLRRLAGGVAHDYNNVLAVIMSFTSFLRESVIEQSEKGTLLAETVEAMLADIGAIERAGARATELTSQLQVFGGRVAVKSNAMDLNALITDEAGSIMELIGDDVELGIQFDHDLHSASADPGQIKQLLSNLVRNASDAMPQGGTLCIETANRDVDPADPLAVDQQLEPGRYVLLTVKDTGHGMSADVVEHAIEPFFTTKPRGAGAGLGLAIAYGIATQAGGDLRIESAPDHGTSVFVYLRAAAARPADAPQLHRSAPGAGATATILVVDDELGIREVVDRVLTKAGYEVLTAADGAHAMALAKTYVGRIDGLLTDVVMPGMHGGELAVRLSAQRPGLPVLYMSGYAAPLVDDENFDAAGATILAKPFTAPALLKAVRTMVAGR